jgi:peptidyl-prolyl cis-trans isomerase SurA
MKRVLLILPLLAIASSASAVVINRIIATVDGQPITKYELQQFSLQSIRTRQGGASLDQAALLDALITDKLVAQEAAEKGVIVRDEDVDRYIDDIKQRNKLDDKQLEAALAAQGVSKEDYRKQIRQEIERQQLIGREIRGKVNVTPEEIQRYYDAHLGEYATPERYKIAHIVFQLPEDADAARRKAVEAEAEGVYEKIKGGEDFGAMAQKYSQDATGKSGGELGWFEPGQLVDSLAEALAKLDVGEISPPVPGPGGVHILKLLEREQAAHRELTAVEADIKEKLYADALEKRFEKWMTEELRQRHDVDIKP